MEGGKIKNKFKKENYDINISQNLFLNNIDLYNKLSKYEIKHIEVKGFLIKATKRATQALLRKIGKSSYESESLKKEYIKSNHPFNNFFLIQERFKEINNNNNKSSDLFIKILKGLDNLMMDLFLPNYKAINEVNKIAFGCVGSSIMISYGLNKDNEINVNAKLADFGHGYLYSKKIHDISKPTDTNDKKNTEDKNNDNDNDNDDNDNDNDNDTDNDNEMEKNLKYVKGMTIGAYQLYNMFFLYCEASNFINYDKNKALYDNKCIIRRELGPLINYYISKKKIIYT